MMPDGGVVQETIVLNDITMWSGSFQDTRNPEALKYLPEIRRLLLEGKNDEAQELMYKHFACGGQGSAFGQGANAPYGAFQLLGNLHLQYHFRDSSDVGYSAYERGLSLDKALAWTCFRKGKVKYRREYFVSQTEDVMIMKLTADRKGMLDFDVAIDRPENYTCYANDGVVYMEGQLDNGKGKAGTKYMVQLKVWTADGRQVADSACIHVKEATTAYVLVSAGTSLWAADYPERVEKLMQIAGNMDYGYLLERHDSAWRYKYNRVELDLGTPQDILPTDQRLARFQEQEDPGLVALYFQYGRYLLISGTRENSFPLNLQGLWANSVQTPWNGDYHLNINLQMNYWPVEIVNLSELHTPLKNLVKDLVTSGEVTAHSFYGAQGWVAHMMTNPWRFTAPGEHASWGATNTGGAWLCEHLWEHYAFTLDQEYLREVYPVLSGASRAGSMYNTPNCWAIYCCGKVFKYLKSIGGLEEMHKRNLDKAKVFYDFLDSSKMFKGTVEPEFRSLMNIPFVTGSADLDKEVVAATKAAGYDNLKGHKSVGGLRASIYNAMPKEGVEALVEFLKNFEANYGK